MTIQPKPLWQQKSDEWALSPSKFVREALRVEPQEWQDNEVLLPIERGERFIAVRSGHGVGKRRSSVGWCLWFLLFRRPCKIPVTANNEDQLRNVFWAEISHWYRELPPFLRELIEITTERVVIKADPSEAFAVAVTARQERPEALQGLQSPNLLFVLDEASGIPDIIFEVASGALTRPGALVVMCGNPTQAPWLLSPRLPRQSGALAHRTCSDFPLDHQRRSKPAVHEAYGGGVGARQQHIPHPCPGRVSHERGEWLLSRSI